jgi:hypothetical protein
MAFGKRQSGVGAAAPTFNTDMAVAQSSVVTEASESKGLPFRSFIATIACCAGLYMLFVNYGPNIVRDLRLSGTWQPAYDLRAMEGKCERTSLSPSAAKIQSVAMPDQAPIPVSFLMLFSGGGGEAMVPVRSTKDRAAVSIHYAAETKLLNRTLSFVFSVGMLLLTGFVMLLLFVRAINDR